MIASAVLARIRLDQAATMFDTCELLTYGAGTVDSYGKPAVSYTSAGTSACGVEHANAIGEGGRVSEALGKTEVPRMTRQLRLPLSANVNQLARVRITHRHGAALAVSELYEVIGMPQRGPGGFVAEISRELVTQ